MQMESREKLDREKLEKKEHDELVSRQLQSVRL